MNPAYFGDSYDIVKRFFCSELRVLGYRVAIDPLLTGKWNGTEQAFYQFVGAWPHEGAQSAGSDVALLIDPDTGIRSRPGDHHVSLQSIAKSAQVHEMVATFDQAFSREHDPREVIRRKLNELHELGCHGVYFNSHARFLFASREPARIEQLVNHLVELGMPRSRFVSP